MKLARIPPGRTVTIVIEVDDDYADENNDTGLTEEGYLRLNDALTSSVASGIVDIRAGDDA